MTARGNSQKRRRKEGEVEAARELFGEQLIERKGFIAPEHNEELYGPVTQEAILDAVDVGSALKRWSDFTLRRGPYIVDFTEDGAHLLAAGQAGDTKMYDLRPRRLRGGFNQLKQKHGQEPANPYSARQDDSAAEPVLHIYPNEKVRAAKFCYNFSCFALAQRNSVCLYDNNGTCLHDFNDSAHVTALDYLPHHFLLVTASATAGGSHFKNMLWRDLSSGKIVKTQKGVKQLSESSTALRHNKYNGVVYTGHTNGTVRLWTPNIEGEAMKFYGGRGGIDCVCPFNKHYVATHSSDNLVRIFDIREAGKPLKFFKAWSSGPVSMDASQTGLLAVGQGPQVNVYMDMEGSDEVVHVKHRYADGNRITSLRFRPFEDVLALGTNKGVDSLLIPGAGSAAVDIYEDNPYSTNKEKAAALVRRLLDKLPLDTIVIDPRTNTQGEESDEDAENDNNDNEAPEAAEVADD